MISRTIGVSSRSLSAAKALSFEQLSAVQGAQSRAPRTIPTKTNIIRHPTTEERAQAVIHDEFYDAVWAWGKFVEPVLEPVLRTGELLADTAAYTRILMEATPAQAVEYHRGIAEHVANVNRLQEQEREEARDREKIYEALLDDDGRSFQEILDSVGSDRPSDLELEDSSNISSQSEQAQPDSGESEAALVPSNQRSAAVPSAPRPSTSGTSSPADPGAAQAGQSTPAGTPVVDGPGAPGTNSGNYDGPYDLGVPDWFPDLSPGGAPAPGPIDTGVTGDQYYSD